MSNFANVVVKLFRLMVDTHKDKETMYFITASYTNRRGCKTTIFCANVSTLRRVKHEGQKNTRLQDWKIRNQVAVLEKGTKERKT